MDEYIIKQKIQDTCIEPRAPETLIQSVILRSRAVILGEQAQQRMESAPAEQLAALAACALVGQLAAVSELPKGVSPEQLAQQLRQAPAFTAALRGGNLLRRVRSGELMQQLAGETPALEQEPTEPAVPQKNAPVL